MSEVKANRKKKRTARGKDKLQKDKKDQTERKTFSTIQHTLSGAGKSFTKGADKVADIILDDTWKGVKAKSKKVRDETATIFKNMTADFKKSMKEIGLKGFLCDVFYQIGRFSKTTKDKCASLFDDIIN